MRTGIYRESVIVDGAHGGAKDKPLWIVAEPGAILDGSDPSVEDGSQYVAEGNGIYSIPFAGDSVYVAVDDTRLYDYTSLADLDWDNLWTDSADGTPRFVKWSGVTYADLAKLKASNTIEKNGFQVEPKYENESVGDFTLIEGSPLLDVGEVIAGINDQFIVGNGPDIGAVERGGANPLPDGGLSDGGVGGNGVGGGPSGGTGGAGGEGGQGETPRDTGSCGCRLGAESAGATSWGAGAFVIGLFLRRRKTKGPGKPKQ